MHKKRQALKRTELREIANRCLKNTKEMKMKLRISVTYRVGA